MKNPIYITHELVMETIRVYKSRNFKKYEQDFENIKSFRRTALGKFVIVEGTVRLYGYKIDGEGYYSGFFDAINQHLYTKEDIQNAVIIEHKNEYVYEPKVKRKKI